jgi:triosephosphate isomerase (TIM)
MARQYVIAGNWKMFKTRSEAQSMVLELRQMVQGSEEVEVVVCPPFTALPAVSQVLEGASIRLGAQNVHWEEEGAFTGEISPGMLQDCGCSYVIIGHSERRQYFHETDEVINRKLKKVLATPLIPILCVGEMLEEREAGRVEEVVLGQLEGDLAGLTAESVSRIIVAYEPVWAIGTGKTATPQIAQEVHSMIRRWLAGRYGGELAASIRILYGGSVKPDNAGELMGQEDIDGALVGGASLTAGSFARIVKFK